MATVKDVEKQIAEIEGFSVRFLNRDNGKDIRGNSQLGNIKAYKSRYSRMARNRSSVADWIETRFKPNYPGFDVKVVMANGAKAHGNYLLSTVRDSYL